MLSLCEAMGKLDPNFFKYGVIASQMWNNIISQAMKDFKVQFDRENDDGVQERTITIPQNQWDHTDCTFHCRMQSAGGDWEHPVYYFRCQLISGYAGQVVKGHYQSLSKYNRMNNGCFIFIPSKTQGNYSLVRNNKDDGWIANGHFKDKIDPQNSDKDCWKALKDYLTKMVQMEIDKVNMPSNELQEPEKH